MFDFRFSAQFCIMQLIISFTGLSIESLILTDIDTCLLKRKWSKFQYGFDIELCSEEFFDCHYSNSDIWTLLIGPSHIR